MSRLERHANPAKRRARTGKQADRGAADPSDRLPPRRVKHPSNKQQMANWFYNSLIVLFVALVCGLFFFGRQLTGR